MLVAITGHTEGIGKSLFEVFKKNGHISIGFSRSNGFDISKPEDIDKICNLVDNCDVFINNAFHEWAQVDLLFKLWSKWKDQDKTICNIGSSMEYRWQTSIPDFSSRKISYRSQKRALSDSCEHLWNIAPFPHVMHICPCLTDTPSVEKYETTLKANSDVFAEWLYRSVTEKNFKIQRLQLCLNKIPGTGVHPFQK